MTRVSSPKHDRIFHLQPHLYGEQGQGPNRTHLDGTRPGRVQAHFEDWNALFLWDVSENYNENVRDDTNVNFVVRFPEWPQAMVRHQVPLKRGNGTVP